MKLNPLCFSPVNVGTDQAAQVADDTYLTTPRYISNVERFLPSEIHRFILQLYGVTNVFPAVLYIKSI